MRGRVNFERFYTAKITSWIRSIFANSPLKVKLTTQAKYFDIYIKFNRHVQLKHGEIIQLYKFLLEIKTEKSTLFFDKNKFLILR